MTAKHGPSTEPGIDAADLARLAVRRGMIAAPFGAIVGALIGLAGGDNPDSGLTGSEMALVFAGLFGFAITPSIVGAVSVARRLRRAVSGASGWFASIAAAAVAGGVWGLVGAGVTTAAGSLAGLDLNISGLAITTLAIGIGGGAVAALLVRLAALTARSTAEPPDGAVEAG